MIRRVVVLAAGRGMRFRPWSRWVPKELVLLGDLAKPLIEHLLAEIMLVQPEEVVLLSSPRKPALDDCFRSLARQFGFRPYLVHQPRPLGTADALWQVRELVGGEDFFLYYADDLWIPVLGWRPPYTQTPPRSEQLYHAHERVGAPVLSLIDIDRKEVSRFGIAEVRRPKDFWKDPFEIYPISRLVEKPTSKKDLCFPYGALVSGMVLGPAVFEAIESLRRDFDPEKSREIYLTDALQLLLERGPVHGLFLGGRWVDVGTKDVYLKASNRIARWERLQEKLRS